jgi:transmembrane sensor
MKQELSKEYIFHFLAGHATPLQKKLIEQWMNNDKHNQELFIEWVLEWETKNPQFVPDAHKAIQKYMAIKSEDAFPREKKLVSSSLNPSAKNFLVYIGIAASLIIMMLSIGWYFQDSIYYKTYQTGLGYNTFDSIQLSDGTKVLLKPNSILQVPRWSFEKGARKVKLQGEAEFHVTHTKANDRFEVLTSDMLRIEVLGTEFVVSSRARGSKVVLNKGRVKLQSLKPEGSKPIIMNPGDVATVATSGKLTVRSATVDRAAVRWADHRFNFDHTTLQEIAYYLEDNFDLIVVFADQQLAERTISGKYKADSTEELLNVLSQLMDISIQQTNNKVYIESTDSVIQK